MASHATFESKDKRSNSGFFKRFSISGSKPSSFGPDHAPNLPDHSAGAEAGYDAINVLNNLIASSSVDRDDVSEMSSSVSTTRKEKSKLSTLFRKKSRMGSMVAFSIADEFGKVRDNWSSKCTAAGLRLAQYAMLEFNKRINAAESADRKTKLNLSKCDLDDDQLILLTKELARKPILSKLELDGNMISTQGAEGVRQLLVLQLELFELMEPALRASCVFLAEVSLAKSKQGIAAPTLEAIDAMSSALAVCNAQNHVYTCYAETSAPVEIDRKVLSEMWTEVVGKALDTKALQELQKSAARSDGWSYAQVEAALLEGLVKQGLLRKLTPRQESIVAATRSSFRSRVRLPSTDSRLGDADRSAGIAASSAHSQENLHDDSAAAVSADDPSPAAPSPSHEKAHEKAHKNAHEKSSPLSLPPPRSNSARTPPSPPAPASSSSTPSSPNPSPSLSAAAWSKPHSHGERVAAVAEIEICVGDSTKRLPHADRHSQQDQRSPSREEWVEGKEEENEDEDEHAAGSPHTPAMESETEEPGAMVVTHSNDSLAINPAASFLEDDSLSPLQYQPTSTSTSSKAGSALSSGAMDQSLYSISTFASFPQQQQQQQVSPIRSPIKSPIRSPMRGPAAVIAAISHLAPTAVATGSSPTASPRPALLPQQAHLKAETQEEWHEEHLRRDVSSHSTVGAVASASVEMQEESEESEDGEEGEGEASEEDGGVWDEEGGGQEENKDVGDRANALSAQAYSSFPSDAVLPAPHSCVPDSTQKAGNTKMTASRDEGASTTTGTAAKVVRRDSSEDWQISNSHSADAAADCEDEFFCLSTELQLESDARFAIDLTDDSLDDAVPAFQVHNMATTSLPDSTALGASAQSLPRLPTSSQPPPSQTHAQVQVQRFAPPPQPAIMTSRYIAASLKAKKASTAAAPASSTGVEKSSSPTAVLTPAASATPADVASSKLDASMVSERDMTVISSSTTAGALSSGAISVADARVFLVHGITRRRFSAEEVNQLATLPQPLHVTQQQDGEKFIIGYEHAPQGNRVTAEGYLVLFSTLPAERTLQLVSDVATAEDIVAAIAGSDSSGGNIQSAILRACFIQHLPVLRLHATLPSLLELDLSGCGLVGRLPANCLPRSLLRLDLSHNQLSECSAVMACASLQELNLGFNCVETVHALPKSLVRLNLECNLVWNKVCLRIVALCPLLQSACLDGNPITVLVPGWAAFFRSMSPQLLFPDGRRVDLQLQQASLTQSSPTSFTPSVKRRKSPPTTLPPATPVTSAARLGPQTQKARDEERALQHQIYLQEVQQQREAYLERLRMAAPRVVRPESDVLRAVQRLSSPKLVTPKTAKRKKGPPSSFGSGSRGEIIKREELSVSSINAQVAPLSKPAPPPAAKWTKAAALEAVSEWTNTAATCLEAAAVLINRVDTQVAQQARSVTTDDVQAFQRDLISLDIADCDPLPFSVKLALNTLHADVGLVATITRLHEKIRDYATLLRKLEGALTLCAGASKSFGVSFHIIMRSETGRLIDAVPKEEVVPAQRRLHQSRERLRSTSPAAAATTPVPAPASVAATATVVAIGRKSVSPPARRAAAGSGSPQSVAIHTMLHVPAAGSSSSTDAARSPANSAKKIELDSSWRANVHEAMSECGALLRSIMDRFTHSTAGIADEKGASQGLAAYVESLKAAIEKLRLDRFDTPVPPNSPTKAELKEDLQALRSYKNLFAQVENMLFLCSKGGIAFEPAFQVLMNSSVGRAVKRALQGAPGLTIVAPRQRSPLAAAAGRGRGHSPLAAASAIESRHLASTLQEIEVAENEEILGNGAEQDVQQALLEEPPSSSVKAALDESLDQLEFTVIAVDPNEEVVRAWLERCECVLGRAAVSLNSAMDLAHSGHPLTKQAIDAACEDHASIDLASCEPPPRAVTAALLALGRTHPLSAAAWEARAKLDTYDDLFAQVENAMVLCFQHRQDFGYAFDLLMRTDVGQRANRCMHGVYDYSAMFD